MLRRAYAYCHRPGKSIIKPFSLTSDYSEKKANFFAFGLLLFVDFFCCSISASTVQVLDANKDDEKQVKQVIQQYVSRHFLFRLG